MSSDYAIKVCHVSKIYHIYDKPIDRLMQSLCRGKKTLYKEFKALNDISFEVKRGGITGIVGRNGSGKSTLLQIICGTLTPSSGTVDVSGRVAALLELGSGFNPEFTGRENVYLNAAVLGLSKEEVDDRFEGIASFADIGDFIEQPVKSYSSGMYVRLAFAIQANVDPEILIVDEALAVGDANFVHKCMLRFHELSAAGTTILFVSHDATAVKTLCDSAIWIDKGEIVAAGASSITVDRYLSSVRNQPVVKDFSSNALEPNRRSLGAGAGAEAEAEGFVKSMDEIEIPNIDRRLGDQSCVFVGMGLYDSEMQRSTIIENDSSIWLRATFKNETLDEETPLTIGCSLRNHRGVDIASCNSEIEGATITAPAKGKKKTVRIGLYMPLLHAGSYSLSVSMGYRTGNGGMQDTDTITNAVIFDVTSKKPVHVLMALKSEFKVETSVI